MVWPLPRPWSHPPPSAVNNMHEGFSASGAPFFWDLVLQAPRPRGRGRPLFDDVSDIFYFIFCLGVGEREEVAGGVGSN